MGKILSISSKLNFTQNTLGSYGLIQVKKTTKSGYLKTITNKEAYLEKNWYNTHIISSSLSHFPFRKNPVRPASSD